MFLQRTDDDYTPDPKKVIVKVQVHNKDINRRPNKTFLCITGRSTFLNGDVFHKVKVGREKLGIIGAIDKARRVIKVVPNV